MSTPHEQKSQLDWLRHSVGAFRRLLSSARDRMDPAYRAWLRQKQETDLAFDRDFGVDTGGITSMRELSVPAERRKTAVDHIASDPSEFTRALGALPVSVEDFTFVDFGSGKGRAILLAAEAPFRRLWGVEHAPELHAIAQKNLAAAARIGARRDAISLVCADAADFVLPLEPLVLYFYHPFGEDVLRPVIASIVQSLKAQPRPVYVLYVNPLFSALWSDAGFVTVRSEGNCLVLTHPGFARDAGGAGGPASRQILA
jgi:SAM-dependent methyltransferase